MFSLLSAICIVFIIACAYCDESAQEPSVEQLSFLERKKASCLVKVNNASVPECARPQWVEDESYDYVGGGACVYGIDPDCDYEFGEPSDSDVAAIRTTATLAAWLVAALACMFSE